MEEHPVQQVNTMNATLRLLTFRITREEVLNFNRKHLVFGLVCTWIVGIGRYWDNPRVGLLQHLGVGSVVYVFVLALLIWLIVLPLKPKDWIYFRVLTFITLVSPPALLYAIPVEKFFSLTTANSINAWFLAIVAAWRVALLFFLMRRLAQINWLSVIIASLLPLTLIVTTLTTLNLEKVIFAIMGGLQETERSGNDTAFGVLFLLTILSVYAFVPIVLVYGVLVLTKQLSGKNESNEK